MAGWMENSLDSGGENVGLGLENGAAAAVDFVGPVAPNTEERTDLFTDLGLGPEAGVGRHFSADPAPDVLIRVEVRAVGWQSDQADPQLGRAQVGAQWVATMRRAVVPDDDQRLRMMRPQLLQ